MKQTTAHISVTPSPSPGANKPSKSADKTNNSTNQFIGAALNMSWQLAIVVLVPILVGSQLDKRLDLAPTMTVLGFIVAMVGTGLIMWKQLQLNSPDVTSKKGPRK